MPLIIQTRFAEIRDFTERVIAFYAQEVGTNKQGLSSRYEVDLDGMDADELLIKFQKQFQVNFDGFRFEDYFYNEGEWSMSVGTALLFPGILAWFTVAVTRIVSRQAADSLTSFWQRVGGFLVGLLGMRIVPKRLTLGDLITSATIGRFIPRSETRLVWK